MSQNIREYQKEYQKRYRKKHRAKLRKQHDDWVKKNRKQYLISQHRSAKKWRLKIRYGLTTDKFFEILKKQNFRCALCREKFSCPKHTHVDHDHVTGIVRGLLCAACNRGLGFLRDSVVILQRGIRYLRKNKHNDQKSK